MSRDEGIVLPDDQETVVVRYFYFEAKARLYAARLQQEGIPSFISNSNTATAFPLGSGGIGLHVRRLDAAAALAVVEEMDRNGQTDPDGADYRDASREDIEFLQALSSPAGRPARWWPWLIGLIVVLLVLRAWFRALGWLEPLDSF